MDVVEKKARDIMSAPPVTIGPAASLEEAARLMLDRRIGGLPVVDAAGDLVGLLAEQDFAAEEAPVPFALLTAPQLLGRYIDEEGVERIYAAARAKKVEDVMRRDVPTVGEDDDVDVVVRTMLEAGVHRVPVVRGRRVVGMIARHDLLRLLAEA